MIKVSVIIPMYNCEDLITTCLDSIELRDDIEIIVIDDCSTDNSFTRVTEWQYMHKFKNFTFLHNVENLGVGLTLNAGYNVAKGEYVGILCSDDAYLKPISEMFKYLDGTDMVYYDLVINDGSSIILNQETKSEWVGATKFTRREFLGDTRRTSKRLYGDKDFFKELMKKNPTEKFTEEKFYYYNFPRENSLLGKAKKEGIVNE